MDPHSFIARAEAQRWIGIAEKLLMSHDFVGSKTFAIRARESDPRLEAADQILAIADTLLAAENQVVGNNGVQRPDFYAILQIARYFREADQIAAQYHRLAVLLNPNQNRFPYADQAFQLVNDAWVVLSNPMRKSMYDSELDFTPQQQMSSLGFNLEQEHHHQHHQQQQHQHNFFYQELSEPPQTFQTRAQSHQHQQLQQHNFLSQVNPVRPVPVREREDLFQQREQEQLFQPQVQPFQITSSPQAQTRPRPQPPMQSPSPPSPAAPPLFWSQAPPPPPPPPQPQQQPQPQPQPPIQPPASPPLAPAAPQPPLSRPQAPPLSRPQQQPSMQPPSSPAPAPPFAWPQTPPTPSQLQPHVEPQPQGQFQQKQNQQQLHQEELQQQQSLEQKAAPVQLSTLANSNNGVMEEEIKIEAEEAAKNDEELPTFWTPCPYCFYMYEYPRVYADCTLRCDNCKRAFQAVPVPSPPAIIEGKEAYFTCSGFLPLGVSASHLKKYSGTRTNSNWTPFSSFNDASSNLQDHSNSRAAPAPKNYSFVNKSLERPIYIDDVTDDLFMGISEPSDDSDVEWGSTNSKKKKMKRMKKGPGYQKKPQVQSPRKGTDKHLQDDIQVQESEEAPTVPVSENVKKGVGSNPRRQSGRVKKELGKLDLNVEFNNNEGEESAPGMSSGNRGHGHGEEENIEGIEFFEGLDEYLSSLPILSVVNDVKVKAA